MSKAFKIVILVFLVAVSIFLLDKWSWFSQKKSLFESAISFPSSNNFFQQFLQTKGDNSNFPDLGNIFLNKEDLSTFTYSSEEETSFDRFVTKDKLIEIIYPLTWMKIDYGKLNMPVGATGLKPVFMAQQLTSNKFVQIVVGEQDSEEELTFKQILETMKETNSKQGWNTEIVSSTEQTKEIMFETIYYAEEKTNNYDMHSLEKMFLLELDEKQKIYLVSFVCLDKNWEEVKTLAYFLIQSAHAN